MEAKYFELQLPSLYIPYKDVKKVEIRMLKGRDEKHIGELTLTNFEKRFKLLLDDVLKGIDPLELTIGDRFYIVIWIAINCYSNLYPVELTCAECLRQVKLDIDLSKLEKIDLPKTFKEPYLLKLTNGETIQLRLLRVKDQIQYLDYVQAKGQDNIIYKLALSVVGEEDLAAKIARLEELSTKDLGLIRAFHDKFYHGVKLEAEYTCPKCGGTGITPVPFRLDLIFPDGATIAKSLGQSI